MSSTTMVCFWCILFPSLFLSAFAGEDKLTTDGDIILGALFPIHQIGRTEKECGVFNELVGYQYMEAMLYALDKINERNDILPGIKLGSIIYDTCRSPIITADKTKEYIKVTLKKSTPNSTEFAGVIGAFKSGNSVIAANFLRVFRIPQISYGSLTVKLSNKNVFNYFLRTVPPDSFFAAALVKLLLRMGWTYVSIVYSSGTWPETGAEEVRKALKNDKICVAKSLQLSRFPTPEDFARIVEELTQDSQPRIVVLVTIQRDSRGLLVAKKKNPRGSRLSLVGSLEWSNRRDITQGLDDIADGTIAFGHREGRIPEFEYYFRNLTFKNYSRNNKYWIGEYWQTTYKCKLRNISVPTNYTNYCSEDEMNRLNTGYKELAPVQVVINAVQAMARGLDALQRHKCPNTTKICKAMRPLDRTLLLEFLRNVTYNDAAFHFPVSFNAKQEVDGNYTLFNFRWDNSSYKYIEVGSWVSRLNSDGVIEGRLVLDDSKIRWAKGNKTAPLSTCRPKCKRNEITIIREDQCCHKCQACAANAVVVNNTCRPCDEGHVPNKNVTSCKKLPLRYVNMDTTLAGFLAFFAVLGIVADAIVFAIFKKNSGNKLIKACGREMCYFMFLGIATIFVVPLSSLSKPTQSLCYFRRFIMGVSFTLCYAPLLMKMFRIHRIFTNANRLQRSSNLIGRRSLLLITTGLVAVQGLFCVLVFSSDPPKLREKFYPQRDELALECDFKRTSFAIYFLYNLVLIVWCTFYAFRTRHFPKNFNEAMHIGITMYLTCVVWVVFLATFLNADYSISRVYWLSATSLLIGWITLLGLFAPKVYQLYTKTEFPKGMLMPWSDSMFPKAESSLDITDACRRQEIDGVRANGSQGSTSSNKAHVLKPSGLSNTGLVN
ncbi:metabotropic glutamate receptor 3-like isoform X2 [Dendronephthya gigantea]|nr:metabotropic glutamate receptor 3-like isoform X2 [Dendronephthya gigantea]